MEKSGSVHSAGSASFHVLTEITQAIHQKVCPGEIANMPESGIRPDSKGHSIHHLYICSIGHHCLHVIRVLLDRSDGSSRPSHTHSDISSSSHHSIAVAQDIYSSSSIYYGPRHLVLYLPDSRLADIV